ncbi:GNAT family N-acetyltransferase [Niallia sp. HCP3S3_B10]|jgi:diamine N-acetyltransferase|uniref:GNAT family N-acetyltransferase n=1 Tax=unclassified Niallia TaxID=2837522 RepID=UPI00203FC5AF|nr:GNAT family N-acetyltransferase [Niallia sp. MER TA 168]MCM3364014.1 GNAT family N-acetyltransferase [Niallia sp. MER TA 168]
MKDITLRDIDSTNFFQCILLKSQESKGYPLFEEHVASNAFSIAQSKVEPEWITKAIYNKESQMIGFAMYGLSPILNVFFITRLMIDYRYQGKGYGRLAMLEIIQELKEISSGEIYTSFVPSNGRAKKLYTSLGFKDTGRVVEFGGETEPLYCLHVS